MSVMKEPRDNVLACTKKNPPVSFRKNRQDSSQY